MNNSKFLKSRKKISNKLSLINPFSFLGGASIGTYRLFESLNQNFKNYAELIVIVDNKDYPASTRSNLFIRYVFYLQAFFNKILCFLSVKKGNQIAGFSFLVPFSIPALDVYKKTLRNKKLYVHALGHGFTCPISLSLILNKANVAKAADDWFLTGGCHYILDCKEWNSGCRNCPRLNRLGKIIAKFNFEIKRKILIKNNFFIVCPSQWLRKKYEKIVGNRSIYISNAIVKNVNDDEKKLITPLWVNNNAINVGIPVTYLNDKRKRFLELLPILSSLINDKIINFLICGRDSHEYKNLLKDKVIDHLFNTSIHSYGNISGRKMVDFYKLSDLIIHAAIFDNSPNTVTEALAYGTPCIVTDNAGSPEHVIRSGGGAVIKNLEDIYGVILKLHQNNLILQSWSEKAQNYGNQELSPIKMAKKYKNLFEI